MLALDIMNQVIEKDQLYKKSKGLGSTDMDGSSDGLATVVSLGSEMAAGYAVGQYALEGKTAPEGYGRDTGWLPTIGVGIGSSILGSFVASMLFPGSSNWSGRTTTVGGLANLAYVGANIYHGYKRHNDSIAWALGWGIAGNPGFAVAQGFAKPIVKENE
jgi:hypothetical protein